MREADERMVPPSPLGPSTHARLTIMRRKSHGLRMTVAQQPDPRTAKVRSSPVKRLWYGLQSPLRVDSKGLRVGMNLPATTEMRTRNTCVTPQYPQLAMYTAQSSARAEIVTDANRRDLNAHE